MPTDEDAQVVKALAGRSGSQSRRGPKTDAGKARVSINALTHGISSTRLVVPGESSTDGRRTVGPSLKPSRPQGRSKQLWPSAWRRPTGGYDA